MTEHRIFLIVSCNITYSGTTLLLFWRCTINIVSRTTFNLGGGGKGGGGKGGGGKGGGGKGGGGKGGGGKGGGGRSAYSPT